MSGDRDLERDLRLAAELGRMPAPTLPAGFTARIVQNATRLPQHGVDASPATIEAGDPHRRRWLTPAIGGAIAASVLAALFMQLSTNPAQHRAAHAQLARNAAAPSPAPFAAAPLAPRAAPAEISADPELAIETPEAPSPTAPAPGSLADADPGPLPEVAPAAPVDASPPESQAPALASKAPTSGTAGKPAEEAFVGPRDDDDGIGAPMPQSGPASGLGISGAGAGAPDVFSPPPPSYGHRSGGMPRF